MSLWQVNAKTKIIGITTGFRENVKDVHNFDNPGYPFYELREVYFKNIQSQCKDEDVVFVVIPTQYEHIERFVNLLDGIVLTGGVGSEKRFTFEQEFIKQYLSTGKPLLAICNGLQQLNVALGGTIDLVKNAPNYKEMNIQHNTSKNEKFLEAFQIKHFVTISKNSLLNNIVKTSKIGTNSHHNFAISNLAPKLIITAKSDDNIIEAVEMPEYKNFLLALEWHPEHLSTQHDKDIISAFCKAVVHSK